MGIFRKHNAAARVEAKGLADPIPSLWALFGMVPTVTGATVTSDQALSVPAVSRAMRLISEAVASFEFCVFQDLPDGTCQEVENDPAAVLLSTAANPWTSGFEFKRDLLIDALSDDVGGIAWVNHVNGQPREIIRYRSGIVQVRYDQATGEPFYTANVQGTPLTLPLSQVVHVRAPFGKAPLTLAREAIGTGIALSDHAARLFANGARPSGSLNIPKGIGQEAVLNARAAWSSTHEGSANSSKTAILYDGMSFTPFSFSSTDAQFIENRKFQILEMARAFGCPPSLLFDLDRATWGNMEQLSAEFLIYCLEPWLQVMEGALTRALCEFGSGKRIVADRDDMTRADLVSRATAISSLISSKTINPNEGREWLGLGPYVGGDEFANPHINPQGSMGAVAPVPAQPEKAAADV
ncbi:MAG: phage portal protein [Pseudomonadota bacterium]